MLAVPIANQSNLSTVQRILDNALEHFSTYGYKGASVREITEASRVTKPTLYYYFKNKEELYTNLAKTCFEKILGALVPAAKVGKSAEERVINFIREYSRLCEEQYAVVKFVHHMALTPERGTPDVGIISFARQITQCVTDIVSDGVKAGEIHPDRATCVNYALNGIMLLRVTSLLIKSREQSDFQVVESSVHCVLSPAHG